MYERHRRIYKEKQAIGMAHIEIDYERCKGCGKCVHSCNYDVLDILDDMIVVASPGKCAVCMKCMESCPLNPPAIKVIGERTGDSCAMHKK